MILCFCCDAATVLNVIVTPVFYRALIRQNLHLFSCLFALCVNAYRTNCVCLRCDSVHAWSGSPGGRPVRVTAGVCMRARLLWRNDTGRLYKSVSDRGSDGVSAFLPPSSPPTVQSIQLLSPQGSRQSIKASGCILLTCSAPLMNSQHDPGWQAGNGCNKDCFCMLFASLINHLTVQQIREPHGNLISHGREQWGGVGGSWEWQDDFILFPFLSSRVAAQGVCRRMDGLVLFYQRFSIKPSSVYLCKSANNNRHCVSVVIRRGVTWMFALGGRDAIVEIRKHCK